MKKINKYENCTSIIHIPEDELFQERLLKATEQFMRKVIEREFANGNSYTSRNFSEKQVLGRKT